MTEATTFNLGDKIEMIHHLIREGALGPKEIAQLRRLDFQRPDQPAFWRLMVTYIEPGRNLSAERLRNWALLLTCMARTDYSPRIPLGAALAMSGYSDLRFTRLLRMAGDSRLTSIQTACLFLANKRQGFNWVDLARLVLTVDPEKITQFHQEMATSYYRNKENR